MKSQVPRPHSSSSLFRLNFCRHGFDSRLVALNSGSLSLVLVLNTRGCLGAGCPKSAIRISSDPKGLLVGP